MNKKSLLGFLTSANGVSFVGLTIFGVLIFGIYSSCPETIEYNMEFVDDREICFVKESLVIAWVGTVMFITMILRFQNEPEPEVTHE